MNDAANEIIANYRANNNNKTTNTFFEYKTKIIGSTPANSTLFPKTCMQSHVHMQAHRQVSLRMQFTAHAKS